MIIPDTFAAFTTFGHLLISDVRRRAISFGVLRGGSEPSLAANRCASSHVPA
jgi:hypothetical protein